MTEINPQLAYAYPVATPVVEKKGLGLASLIVAVALFVISLIWAIANGVVLSSIVGVSDDFASGFEAGTAAGQTPAGALAGLSIGAHVLIGTLAGVTAIVLGIIAIVTKRGRVFGIVGLSLAVLAPIVSFVAYSVAGGIAAAA